MRGICRDFLATRPRCRFNPAYAGNIARATSRTCEKQVQPRVCGEYAITTTATIISVGSTPRMRGICSRLDSCSVLLRFNPAYAGNILGTLCTNHQSQVQPRVCGEYWQSITKSISPLGSTPRMRGIYPQERKWYYRLRFNPAYAGNILH